MEPLECSPTACCRGTRLTFLHFSLDTVEEAWALVCADIKKPCFLEGLPRAGAKLPCYGRQRPTNLSTGLRKHDPKEEP